MPPDPKTKALQLNLEGLLKLLGGTPDERLRFWEIFKGVTRPRETKLINAQIDAMAAHVKAVEVGVKALKETAQQIAKEQQ